MHFATSTIVALLSVAGSVVSQDTTTQTPATTPAPSNPSPNTPSPSASLGNTTAGPSSLYTSILALASNQLSDPALLSQLSTLSTATSSNENLASDIAFVASNIAASQTTAPTPAWITAAGPSGAVASAINADASSIKAATGGGLTRANGSTQAGSPSPSSPSGSPTPTQNDGAAVKGHPTGVMVVVGGVALGLAALL